MEEILVGPLRRKQLKTEVQRRIQRETDAYWQNRISSLLMQGDFLSLLIEENDNVTWKSFLWGLPRGVAKFAVNASLNTLPTGDNLRRWGKRTSDVCRNCGGNSKQTLHHVLSLCNSSLEQGRYTFRHDSCLRTIVDFITGKLKAGFELFSDLPGNGLVAYGTIPVDIVVTLQRPDLVLINRSMKRIVVFELTVPWDGRVEIAHGLKMNKYAALVIDLENAGFIVDLMCFEISVRGQVTKANKMRLKSLIHKYTDAGSQGFKKLTVNISKAALLGSFAIFCARDEAHWSHHGDLSVQI